MKKNVCNRLLKFFAGIMFVFMSVSCVGEQDMTSGNGKNDEVMVTFAIQVPGTRAPESSSQTRAITEIEENKVTDIDILVFEPGGNGKFLYKTGCSGADIVTDQSNSGKKTFTVKLRVGEYNLVVLGNSRSIINAVDLTEISKNDLLSSLKATMVGKWPADSSMGFTVFPMWGDVGDKNIQEDSKLTDEPVKLVRAVARVDVKVSETVDDFTLTDVYVYNYNTAGSLVPAASGWDATDNKALTPNVPTSSTLTEGPLIYTATDGKCEKEIYIFEVENHTDGLHTDKKDLLERTCLVVGGWYGADDYPTYYRIDFVKEDGASLNYLDVLRNYKYVFNISSVSGRGYEAPETAFKSAPINIKAEMLAWNSVGGGEVVFDGQNYLSIKPETVFSFTKEANSTIVKIKTNVPGGWQVTKITEADGTENNSGWLTIDKTNDKFYGSGEVETELTATVGENTTKYGRTGLIYIKAGRLEAKLTIAQSAASGLALHIVDPSGTEIDELIFPTVAGVAPTPKSFTVYWAPEEIWITISREQTFSFPADASGVPPNGGVGPEDGKAMLNYTISPPAFTAEELAANPFLEKKMTLTFYASINGIILGKNLVLRQISNNVKPIVDDIYMMDGTRKSFSVRSNSDFKVTIKSNPNNVISSLTTSGAANTTADGEKVYFNIINDIANPTLYQRDVVVTISSPKGLFTPVDVTLNCVSGEIKSNSNSYIVAPNGIGILIPVSRANESELGMQLAASDVFTGNLVWTENPSGVGSGSNIRLIKPIRNATNVNKSYLLVVPGSGSGNAVVAIKKNGTILWSWHIWVTNYVPTPTEKWMDRNLGAMSNKIGDVGTLGLYYQWGRKDPFARAKSFSINTDYSNSNYSGTVDLFDSSGSKISPLRSAEVTVQKNLFNAVAYPTTFYYNGYSYSWYTNASPLNKTLWGATKTIYDPCPLGYRVPSKEEYDYPNFTANVVDYGRNIKDRGGYYPYGGIRNNFYGPSCLRFVGIEGVVWTSAAGVRIRFSKNSMNSEDGNSDLYHAYGDQIRCVKESTIIVR